MAKGIQHITPFSPEDSTGDTDSVWTLFLHTGVYVMVIGSLIPAGLGYFAVISIGVNLPDYHVTFNSSYHALYFCG